jgi:hypothetical protein
MTRNKLVVFWSKREDDFLIRYPRSPDGHLAYGHFCAERQRYDYTTRGPVFDPSFVQELEHRGYDVKTLRFSVELKAG